MPDINQLWTAIVSNPLIQLSVRLAGLYVLAIYLAMVFWTVRDAQQRTENQLLPYLAGLMVVVLNIFGLFLYLIVRPKETLGEAYERQLAEESLLAEAEQRVVCPTPPAVPGPFSRSLVCSCSSLSRSKARRSSARGSEGSRRRRPLSGGRRDASNGAIRKRGRSLKSSASPTSNNLPHPSFTNSRASSRVPVPATSFSASCQVAGAATTSRCSTTTTRSMAPEVPSCSGTSLAHSLRFRATTNP